MEFFILLTTCIICFNVVVGGPAERDAEKVEREVVIQPLERDVEPAERASEPVERDAKPGVRAAEPVERGALPVVRSAHHSDYTEDRRRDYEAFKQLLKRKVYKCPGLGHKCTGVVTCCNNGACYWQNGYSPFTKGVCVKCISESQTCQRNDQCCSGLQCDKTSDLSTNGRCLPPRPEGDACVDDTQCISGDCSDRWYTRGGYCQA